FSRPCPWPSPCPWRWAWCPSASGAGPTPTPRPGRAGTPGWCPETNDGSWNGYLHLSRAAATAARPREGVGGEGWGRLLVVFLDLPIDGDEDVEILHLFLGLLLALAFALRFALALGRLLGPGGEELVAGHLEVVFLAFLLDLEDVVDARLGVLGPEGLHDLL